MKVAYGDTTGKRKKKEYEELAAQRATERALGFVAPDKYDIHEKQYAKSSGLSRAVFDAERYYAEKNIARVNELQKNIVDTVNGSIKAANSTYGPNYQNTYRSYDEVKGAAYNDARTARQVQRYSDELKDILDRYGMYYGKEQNQALSDLISSTKSTYDSLLERAQMDMDYRKAWSDPESFYADLQTQRDLYETPIEELEARAEPYRRDLDIIKNYHNMDLVATNNRNRTIPDGNDYTRNPYEAAYRALFSGDSGYKDENDLKARAAEANTLVNRAKNARKAIETEKSAKADPNFDALVAQGKKGIEDGTIDNQFRHSFVLAQSDEATPWIFDFDILTDGNHEDQLNTLYYLSAKDPQLADEYLENIQDNINLVKGQRFKNDIQQMGALAEIPFATYSGVESTLENIVNGTAAAIGQGKDYYETSATDYAMNLLLQDYVNRDNWWENRYGDIVLAGAQQVGTQLPAILAGHVVGAAAGAISGAAGMTASTVAKVTNIATKVGFSAPFAVSAFGGAYKEMINAGYSPDQAATYGVINAISETTLQNLLGGIMGGVAPEKLGGAALAKYTAATSGVKSALGRFAVNAGAFGIKALASASGEFIEESLQEILDPYFKNFVTGQEIEPAKLSDALYAGLMGALTSFVLEGASNASEINALNKTGRQVLTGEQGGFNVDTLKQIGSQFDASSLAAKLASKIDVNSTPLSIGMLMQEVGANLNSLNQSEITGYIERRYGLPRETIETYVKGYADYINRYSLLNDSQQEDLKNALKVNVPLNAGLIEFIANNANDTQLKNRLDRGGIALNSVTSDFNVTAASDILGNTEVQSRNRAYAQLAENVYGEGTQLDFARQERGIPAILDSAPLTGADAIARQGLNTEYNPRISGAVAEAKARKDAELGDYKVSKDGQRRVNGEVIRPVGFSSADIDGDIGVRLSNGETVSAKNIEYRSKNDAKMIHAINSLRSKGSIGTNNRGFLFNVWSRYDGKTDPETYLNAAVEAYRRGYLDQTLNVESATDSVKKIAQATAESFWEDGQRERKADDRDADAAKKARNKERETNRREGRTRETARVSYDESVDETKLKKHQRIFADVARVVTQNNYMPNVRFFASSEDENGKRYFESETEGRVSSNGWYDSKTNTIWVDVNAGLNGEGAILYTLSHELTHWAKAYTSTEAYNAFSKFVLDNYARKGVSVTELVKAEQAVARSNGRTLNDPQALDEVIANACEAMLSDPDVVIKLAALNEKNPGLVKKIINHISGLLNKLARVIKAQKFQPTTTAGRIAANFDGLANRWTDLVKQANNNFKYVTEQREENADSGVQHQSRQIEDIRKEMVETAKERNMAEEKFFSLKESKEYETLYGKLLDRTLSDDEFNEAVAKYSAWEKESGFAETVKRLKEINERADTLDKEFNTALHEAEAEAEQKELEASGLSEADFHCKKAVSEFGYTPYFYDAGYITPNGRMLNFSGEKGKHYGTRGEDHRAIGVIYTGDTSGSAAMFKFMGEGNIRIMAESPGIDISTNAAPTREQYSTIERFVNQSKSRESFNVDFTDENGNVVGNLEYEGKFSSVRVLNDIRRYFETGELNRQSDLQRFLYQERQTGAFDVAPTTAEMTETAKKIKRAFGLNKSVDTITEELSALYSQLQKELAKEVPDFERIGELSDQTAERLISQKARRMEFAQEILDNLKSTYKNSAIYLDDQQIGEINSAYGSLARFKAMLRGSGLTFTTDPSAAANSLDSVWQELSGRYPGYFSSDTTPTDMPSRLVDIVERLNNTYAEEDLSGAKKQMAQILGQGYQEYDSTRKTPRAQLADALLTQVGNGVKGSLIRKYRSNLRTFNTLESQLGALNKQITALQKSDPKSAELKELKQTRIILEAQINQYDKSLLSLEAMKPIRKVIAKELSAAKAEQKAANRDLILANRIAERAAARKEARKDTERAVKAARREGDRALREAALKSARDVREARREGKREVIEKLTKQQNLERINTILLDLYKRAVTPSKDAYMPEGLREPVQDLVNALTEQTVTAKTFKDALDGIRDTVKPMVESGAMDAKDAEVLNGLFVNALNLLGIEGTELAAMTNEQLDAVKRTLKAVSTVISNANKLLQSDIKASRREAGINSMRQVKDQGRKSSTNTVALKGKEYSYNLLRPTYFFKDVVGSETISQLFDEMQQKGEADYGRRLQEATDFFSALSEKYEERKWKYNEKKVVKDIDPALTEEISDSKKLYDAIVGGDSKTVDSIRNAKQYNGMRVYASSSEFDSAVRRALRLNDERIAEASEARKSGDEETYERIVNEIAAEGNFSVADIRQAIGTYSALATREQRYGKGSTKEERRQAAIEAARMANPDLYGAATGDFELTLGQCMALYAYSKRAQGLLHLLSESGGIELEENVVHRITQETLDHIANDILTPEQKAFVDEAVNFLSTTVGGWGNEVTETLYGEDFFTEEYYLPILTTRFSRSFNPEQLENAVTRDLSRGFTKALDPNARNAIVINDFLQIWAKHVTDMASYSAFAVRQRNFNAVYNFKTDSNNGVRQYIARAFGDPANAYIRDLLTDMNTSRRKEGGGVDKTLSFLLSTFKRAKVAANIAVVVQQPFSICRAFPYIEAKYLHPGDFNIIGKNAKRDIELMHKYAPVSVIKDAGGFDMGSRLSHQDYILGRRVGTWKQVADAKISEITGFLAAKADLTAWTAMWRMAVRKAQAQGLTGEAMYQRAGQLFTKAITLTQVYDSTLSRPGAMRGGSAASNAATAFMSEPLTTLSMAMDGAKEIKNGNKAFGGKIMASVAMATLMTNIARALWYATRDDDDDEAYVEKFLESFSEGFFNDLLPVNYLPIIKDMYSVLQGYTSKNTVTAPLTDFVSSFKKVTDKIFSGTAGINDYLNALGTLADLTGIPLKNLVRDGRALVNMIGLATDEVAPNATAMRKSFWSGMVSAIPALGLFGGSENRTDALYGAVMIGDAQYYARLVNSHKENGEKRYPDQKSLNTALKKGLRDNDKRIAEAAAARNAGDFNTYSRIVNEIVGEKHFNKALVVDAIAAEAKALTTSAETPVEETAPAGADSTLTGLSAATDSGLYASGDISTAVNAFTSGSGDEATLLNIVDELIEDKVSNGMTLSKAKASVKASTTTALKAAYKTAYAARDRDTMKQIRELMRKTKLYGGTTEVKATADKWLES